jgi:signal transduction histidine kinase
VNAADALSMLPEGLPRTITISTFLDGATAATGAVVLRFADNGPGIPPDIAHTVFEPFVTTKDVGAGTGLGLAVCKRIVEEHGGTIVLEDSVPGAAFMLRFPVPSER